eukprot:9018659-Alexandrium_andersonii.AAC.1
MNRLRPTCFSFAIDAGINAASLLRSERHAAERAPPLHFQAPMGGLLLQLCAQHAPVSYTHLTLPTICSV